MKAEALGAAAGTRAPAGSRRSRMLGYGRHHPVLSVFAVALLVRAAVAVGVALFSDGTLFPDDGRYLLLATEQAEGDRGLWDDYAYFLYERTGALLGPITALFWLFGSHAIIGQLWVALVGAAAAAVTTRLAMEVMELRWALVAGGMIALLPSQVLWSSIIMKDASVWLLLAVIAFLAALAARERRPARLLALGVAALAALVLLGFLRHHTLVIAGWALFLAAVIGGRDLRALRVTGALALAVAVPWAFGEGPAGHELIPEGSLAERRAANAVGANTAVVPTPTEAARYGSTDEPAADADLEYLPEGLTVVLVQPYPWEGGGSDSLKLARAESPLWYALLLLALAGLLSVRRSQLPALAFPLLAGGATLLMYALTEGNLGTAYRHRGEVVGAIALLMALGTAAAFSRLRTRSWSRRPG